MNQQQQQQCIIEEQEKALRRQRRVFQIIGIVVVCIMFPSMILYFSNSFMDPSHLT